MCMLIPSSQEPLRIGISSLLRLSLQNLQLHLKQKCQNTSNQTGLTKSNDHSTPHLQLKFPSGMFRRHTIQDPRPWLFTYIVYFAKNATPLPFRTRFWFHLLDVKALGKGLKTLLLLLLLLQWNIYLWLQQTHWCQSKDLHFRRGHILCTA